LISDDLELPLVAISQKTYQRRVTLHISPANIHYNNKNNSHVLYLTCSLHAVSTAVFDSRSLFKVIVLDHWTSYSCTF